MCLLILLSFVFFVSIYFFLSFSILDGSIALVNLSVLLLFFWLFPVSLPYFERSSNAALESATETETFLRGSGKGQFPLQDKSQGEILKPSSITRNRRRSGPSLQLIRAWRSEAGRGSRASCKTFPRNRSCNHSTREQADRGGVGEGRTSLGLDGSARGLDELGQRRDVGLRHLQGVVLRELLIVAQLREDGPKTVEGLVEVVHPAALAGVGGEAALLPHAVRHLAARPLLPGAAPHAAAGAGGPGRLGGGRRGGGGHSQALLLPLVLDGHERRRRGLHG